MPGRPATSSAPRPAAARRSPLRRLAAGIGNRPQRAFLDALMIVAVLVLERRLRKAVRSGGASGAAGGSPAGPASGSGTGTGTGTATGGGMLG